MEGRALRRTWLHRFQQQPEHLVPSEVSSLTGMHGTSEFMESQPDGERERGRLQQLQQISSLMYISQCFTPPAHCQQLMKPRCRTQSDAELWWMGGDKRRHGTVERGLEALASMGVGRCHE